MTKKTKKIKIKDKINYTRTIEGFTKEFESRLNENLDIDHKLNSEELRSRITYDFVVRALVKESPSQLINAVNTLIKGRYKNHLEDEAKGFLYSMMAKGYAYLAYYNYKDDKSQKKLMVISKKLFELAYKKGYKPALEDFINFKNMFKDVNDEYPFKLEKDVIDKYGSNKGMFNIANLYFSFSLLVEDADRVLRDRRALISDKSYFDTTKNKYYEGMNDDKICAMCYGLCLIIDGDKKEGLKLVKENFPYFKDKTKDIDKLLFKSDARRVNKALEIIENKIVNKSISK